MQRLVLAVADKLGIDTSPGAHPTAAGLAQLQRAFVSHVTYETVDLQLGHPPALDPTLALGRIAVGRGGFCFVLNAALLELVRALGYAAELHTAGVSHTRPNLDGNHCALTVAVGGERYLVDGGLGDAVIDPIPLRAGTYPQGPLTFELRRSALTDGWQLRHDPKGSFTAVDIAARPATLDEFAAMHRHLSTSPTSGFVQTLILIRRRAAHVDIVRARTLTRVDAAGIHQVATLASGDELLQTMADVFDYPVDVLGADDRAELWERAAAQHETFIARSEPSS